MMVKCVRVEKKEAESLLSKLRSTGIIDGTYKIERDEHFVYIPVKDNACLPQGIEIVERELSRRQEKAKHYSQILSLPPELGSHLPSSFDIIGEIAVIKIPDEVKAYEREIGEALLKAQPSIKSVLADEGVSGDYRVRRLRHIAGLQKTKTVHREYGLRFEVDLAKVYFSPRLANEHQRVASKILGSCVVIDMFAGVGPFSIAIAKKNPEAKVYAIDINPDAYALLLRNIEINKVKNVQAILGDAKKVIWNLPEADYIIMNLPHGAHAFLADALKKLKEEGIIFLYLLCERKKIDEKVREIESQYSCQAVYREVHTYSPLSSIYAIEVKPLRQAKAEFI